MRLGDRQDPVELLDPGEIVTISRTPAASARAITSAGRSANPLEVEMAVAVDQARRHQAPDSAFSAST
jgi:hypothetical protein